MRTTVTTEPLPTARIGDLVVLDPEMLPGDKRLGRVYRVTKINPKTTAAVDLIDGTGLKADHFLWVPASDEQIAAAEAAPAVPTFVPGQIVVVSGPRWKGGAAPYVVLKNGSLPDHYRITKLGGDSEGRYYPNIPAQMLREATAEEVMDHLTK